MQQDYERCENKMHAFLMKIVVKNTYIPVSRKFQYEKKSGRYNAFISEKSHQFRFTDSKVYKNEWISVKMRTTLSKQNLT